MTGFLCAPPDISQPVVITNDGGGVVENYAKIAIEYGLEKRRVEIRGSCRSACSLALGIPTVCVGPGAEVKFHHAYEAHSQKLRTDITDKMLKAIPPRVANQVRPYITVEYNKAATLDYNQLVVLGIKPCDAPTKVASLDRTTDSIMRAKPISRESVVFASPVLRPSTAPFNARYSVPRP